MVATFCDSQRAGVLTYAAACALGAEEVGAPGVLENGAGWIKAQAQLHSPRAVKVLDWTHVARAVHKAVRAARPGAANREERRQLQRSIPERLWQGDAEGALEQPAALRPAAGPAPVSWLEEAIRYLREQRPWPGDYQAWKDEGAPGGQRPGGA